MRDKTELVKEMMQNYPESGAGNSLKCADWDYDKMEFTFIDVEEDKTYKVDLPMLLKGLDQLLEVIGRGQYFNCGQVPNLLSEGYQGDGQDDDALVQCAIFGDVIYG